MATSILTVYAASVKQTNGGVQPQAAPQVAAIGSFRDLFRMKPPGFQGILDPR